MEKNNETVENSINVMKDITTTNNIRSNMQNIIIKKTQKNRVTYTNRSQRKPGVLLEKFRMKLF